MSSLEAALAQPAGTRADVDAIAHQNPLLGDARFGDEVGMESPGRCEDPHNSVEG